jgi:transposase
MRFAGIDIASETHVVAVVDEASKTLVVSTSFQEDAAGYSRLRELLGSPRDLLVAMEATGHYWQNLFAFLASEGFTLALLNPLRTHRFAEEELERTKTDAIDAVGIARFAAQKHPAPTRLPDSTTLELRELVRLRTRLQQDLDDRVRQLHRVVDLGFPEFIRHVRTLDSELATAILHDYPTAVAFQGVSPRRLAALRYDGRHKVGDELARALIEAARTSVGRHHGPAYRVQVRYFCEDLDVLRRRMRELDRDIERTLREHEVGRLLTTIEGVGPQTAARIIGTVGDPAEFRSAAALASYVGIAPGKRDSGKRQARHAPLSPIGNAALRRALWMPTLTAVKKNPWLRAYYERLRSEGKPAKVALVAAMRKLLVAVYAVARDRKPFVPKLSEVAASA